MLPRLYSKDVLCKASGLPGRILLPADCDANVLQTAADVITGGEVGHLQQLPVCMWQEFEQKHSQLPLDSSKNTVFPNEAKVCALHEVRTYKCHNKVEIPAVIWCNIFWGEHTLTFCL